MELIIALSLIGTCVISISVMGVLALRPRRIAVARLKTFDGAGGPAIGMAPDHAGKRIARKRDRARAHLLKTPINMGDASQTRKMLHQAGYRSGGAHAIFSMVRTATMLVLPGIFLVATWRMAMLPAVRFFGFFLLLLLGYIAPKMVVRWRVRKRQHRLRLSLPDALDLLVICVEAGMGLNQAIVKVSEELRETHPEISEELKLVNLEIRSGRTRAVALKNLGLRTGVDDIISLAAMLIQTDKFGTSVARSLRTHSDSLRVERIQRAEEAAAKTTIKLIFPLLLCVFPALMVVILGPAFLNLAQIFGETINNTQ